jgi:hypothetical protein
MTRVAERKHASPQEARQPPWRRADGERDHDLPLLAIELEPHVGLQWESLMDDGVVPGLLLGAERRHRGRR